MVLRRPPINPAILAAGRRPLLAPPGVRPGLPPPGLPPLRPPGLPPPGIGGPPGLPPGMGPPGLPPGLGAGPASPVTAARPDLEPRMPGGQGIPGDGGVQGAPPPPPGSPAEIDMATRQRQMREAQQQAQNLQQSMISTLMRLATEQAAEEERDPLYPKWYKKDDYPKPQASEVEEIVKRDHRRHGTLLQRMAEDLDAVDMVSFGVFRNRDKRVEQEFRDPSLAADVHMLATMGGTADIYYDALRREAGHEDEAEAKEAALAHWRECEEERHAEGNADLGYDEMRMLLVYGRICKRIILNPWAESTDDPFITHLIDPATVFPTYDGRHGLTRVTRYYSMPVGKIIGTFSTKDKDLRSQLLTGKDKNGGSKEGRNDHTRVEVMEYWDRRWYGIIVDGDWILGPIDHKYGCVPWIIELAPMGRPPFTSSPWGYGVTPPTGENSYTDEEELAAQGLSYIHFMKYAHHTREALLGRFLTEAAKSINPPMLVYQDDIMWRKGAPKISSAEGARNRLVRGREEVSPFPTAPTPNVTNPLMVVLNEAYGKWGLSPASYGLAENAGQTGTAIESLTSHETIKAASLLKAKERFHRREAELKLKLLRDHGWHLGSDERHGEFDVPKGQPGKQAFTMLTLTHGMLRRTGIDIKVRLTSLKLQNLGPLGNAVMLWRNAGLMSKTEALELRDVKDPEATLRQIAIEDMRSKDEFKNAEMLTMLRKEGEWELYYEFKNQLMMAKMGQNAPGGPGGPPGMGPPGDGGAPPGTAPPDGGGGGGPVGIQGASMPQYGSPAGQEGGRPPGPPSGGGLPY